VPIGSSRSRAGGGKIQRAEEEGDAGGDPGKDARGVAGPRPADGGIGGDDERKRKQDEQGRGRV
jgi:hypothetical protein